MAGGSEATDGAPATYRTSSFWLDDLVASGLDALAAAAGACRATPTFDVCDRRRRPDRAVDRWYLLRRRDPALRIAVLEKEIAGFGASGRNGGWCSALFPRSAASLEREHGCDAALAMRRAMVDTVDEVGRVAGVEGIDCDFEQRRHGGVRARSSVQRARRAGRGRRGRGATASTARDCGGAGGRRFGARLAAALGAMFDPACARLHPAKLVRGLAEVVEARGVAIFEQHRGARLGGRAVRSATSTRAR